MFSFNDKSWFTSKTFWTAVVMFAVGGLEATGTSVPVYVLELLAGFGLYAVRDAVSSNK
ncbi:MAG: hypothetical protein HN802_02795 [Candidatus Jacksonbacteria bacterium]|jgi:hypothetical protein|nr:hypothetical protein [Candidatus Jacksonbacteria bacterium]